MLGLGFFWYVSENINNIVAGKILGVVALGFYALATNIGNFINTHFTVLLEGVMFPAYAKLQDDLDDMKRVYFKTTKFVSVISLPFGVALVLLAREFVTTLYGVKWLAIVPLIQIFGAMQLLIPILGCSGSLFLGSGRPGYNFNLTIYPLLVKVPVLILFTKLWGLIGIALSEVVLLAFVAPVNVALVRRIVRFRYRDFFVQFLPSICCSIFMALALITLKGLAFNFLFSLTVFHHLIPLLTYSVVGLSAYVAAYFFIDRSVVREIIRMLFKLESV